MSVRAQQGRQEAMNEKAVRRAANDVAASMRKTAATYQDDWSPGALECFLLAAKEVEQIPDAEDPEAIELM